jgi:Cu/Ag efflux protein CusF
MKKHRIILVFVATLVVFASCTKNGLNETAADPAGSNRFKGTGIVLSVDAEQGSVSIKHEAIEGLMSAMTMTFKAGDKSIVSGLAENDNVNFTLEKTENGFNLVEVSKNKAVAPAGMSIYKTSCAKCHGDKGEGKRKGIPLIEGHALDHSEEDFIKQVTDGGEKMPAFGDKLSEEQIKTVVSYVKNEIQGAVKKEGSENGEEHKH